MVTFLAEDGANTVLYRWELSRSPSGDENVYTSARYTLENMDEAGLAECAQRAAQLSETYGVELLIGMDAVRVEPWDYESSLLGCRT